MAATSCGVMWKVVLIERQCGPQGQKFRLPISEFERLSGQISDTLLLNVSMREVLVSQQDAVSVILLVERTSKLSRDTF